MIILHMLSVFLLKNARMSLRGDKIAIARDSMLPGGWSQADLAKALKAFAFQDLTEQQLTNRIGNWETRAKNVPDFEIDCIAEATDIETSWFDDPEPGPPKRRTFEAPEAPGDALPAVPADTSVALDFPMFPVAFGMVAMRYAGVVPASSDWGDPLDSEIPIEMDAKYFKKNRFVCRVKGFSCYPALQQGDLTVWEVDKEAKAGSIVIAQRREDFGCTVKELIEDRLHGRFKLEPINSKYDSPPDGEGWDVIARLVGIDFEGEDGTRGGFLRPSGLKKSFLLRIRLAELQE